MIKNEIYTALKKLNSDETAYISLEVQNLHEIRRQSGNLFNKNFTCDVNINWSSAKIQTEMPVSELINLMEKKDISEMSDQDFLKNSIEKTFEGNVSITNINWESVLNETEKNELRNYDLESESDIIETKLQFGPGCITSIILE